MNLGSLVGVALFALATCGVVRTDTNAIRHVRMSSDDLFLICARALFGKPVFREAVGPWSVESLCLPSLDGTKRRLEEDGFRAFDDPSGVFITSRYALRLNRTECTRVRFELVAENRKSSIGLPVPGEDVARLARRVLNEARPIPASVAPSTGPDKTCIGDVVVDVDVAPLKAGAESVVIAFAAGGAARLVYGERRGDAYDLMWDSPLTSTQGLGWNYVDLNGDAQREIQVWGEASPSYRTLVVFDLDGQELTRHSDCVQSRSQGIDVANGTCPIVAEEIEFEDAAEAAGRHRDILTWSSGSGERRYRLSDGAYRVVSIRKQEPLYGPSGNWRGIVYGPSGNWRGIVYGPSWN